MMTRKELKEYRDTHLIRDNQCPYCGKWFHSLGIASHRARCREKYNKKNRTKMSRFLAKAFVETSKEVLRGKVIDTFATRRNYSVWGDIIAIGGGWVDEIQSDPDAIDCNFYANGDEDLAVKLFLALAEMRDDTDKQQWYKTDWGFFKAEDTNHVLREARCCIDRCKSIGSVHKLPPLELAEAVMRGEIKL